MEVVVVLVEEVMKMDMLEDLEVVLVDLLVQQVEQEELLLHSKVLLLLYLAKMLQEDLQYKVLQEVIFLLQLHINAQEVEEVAVQVALELEVAVEVQ